MTTPQGMLAPCPFCGCETIATTYIRDGRAVACMDCAASVRAFAPDAEAKAIKLWNTRQAAAPQGREALTNDEIGTLQAAVENLRSPDKAEEWTIEAAWRIASKLEQIAKRALTPAVAPDAGAGGSLPEKLTGELACILEGCSP